MDTFKIQILAVCLYGLMNNLLVVSSDEQVTSDRLLLARERERISNQIVSITNFITEFQDQSMQGYLDIKKSELESIGRLEALATRRTISVDLVLRGVREQIIQNLKNPTTANPTDRYFDDYMNRVRTTRFVPEFTKKI